MSGVRLRIYIRRIAPTHLARLLLYSGFGHVLGWSQLLRDCQTLVS